MFSKNNWQAQFQKHEAKKQRFALRKLTIGVASVLIGFTFISLGTAARADTAVSTRNEVSQVTNDNQSAALTKHQLTTDHTNTKQIINTLTNSQPEKTPMAVTPQADNRSMAAQQYNTNANSTAFVSMGDKWAPFGQLSPDLNGTGTTRFGYGARQTSTTKIAYRLQTFADASVYTYDGVQGYPGKGGYILYAPTGFEFDTSQTDWLSFLHGSNRVTIDPSAYKYQLGTVDGKQAMLVTFPKFVPYYGDGVIILADLKLRTDAKAGTYTASDDLIRPIDNQDGSFKSGTTQDVIFTSDGTSSTYTELTAPSGATSQNNQYIIGEPVNETPGQWSGTIFTDNNASWSHNNTTISQTVNYGIGSGETTTAEISYRLSTYGSGPQVDGKGVGKTEYLVLIPRGFTTDQLTFINGATINGQIPTAENLGMVGPNGEQVFLVKVPYTPGYSADGGDYNSLRVNAKLTAQNNVSGVFTETANDLIHPINNGNLSTTVAGDGNGGTATINIGGTTYQIIKSTATSENNSITYVVNPKNTTPANWSGTIWTNDNAPWSHDNTNLSPAVNFGTEEGQTKTATISYRISSYGSGPQLNNRGIGPTQYLITIPYGFKASGLTFSNGVDGKIPTYEDLGMVGLHDEQVFLVTVPYTPGYSSDNGDSYSLRVNAKLTAQGGINGVYTVSANDLLHPIANGNYSTDVINDNGVTGGVTTITLGGKTYQIIKSTAFNNSVSYLMGDAQLPVNFNGSITWEPVNGMYGNKPGDTPSATITYNIKSNSNQATGGQDGFQGQSQYLIYIPAGFEVSGIPTAGGSYGQTSDVKFKNLGYVGGDDERQVWLVTAPTRPSDSDPLQIKVNLVLTTHKTKDENGADQPYGGYYKTNTGALLQAINQTVDGENQFSDQTTTITLGNGSEKKTYQVALADGDNNSYGYTIDIGTTLLNKSSYTVSGTKGIAVNTPVASSVAGYEQLTIEGMSFNPGAISQEGNYVDVHWGVLYNDDGTIKRKLYDNILSSTVGVILSNDGHKTVIGHVYNMGDFYRLVFNEKAKNENANGKLIANSFELNWATSPQYEDNHTTNNDGHTATVNNGPFVYTYTDNQSKDGEIDDSFIPKNDVLIGSTADQSNSQQFTSGIKLQQEYVYQGSIYKNNKDQSASTWGPTRTWYGDSGSWTCSKVWQNTTNYVPNLKQTNKSFDLILQLPANPNEDFTINAKSGDEVAKELYDIISKSQNRKLSNELTDNQANYLVATTTKGGIQDNAQPSDVSVVREQDKTNPNRYIYHIKFSKQFDLDGGVSLVTVTANSAKLGDIQLPHGVSSYDQDMAAWVQKGNYNGANVGNEKLQKALEDLPEVQIITTDTAGTTTTYYAYWTTFISHTAEKAPDNAMTVTKASSYNFAGGKSIWIWSGDNELNNILVQNKTLAKGQLTRAMLIGGLNKDNGVKNNNGGETKPVVLEDVENYVWLGGNFTDNVTPGWSKQSGMMKITFTDGSSTQFELNILVLQQPYALPTKVPAGYLPSNRDGGFLFADWCSGPGHVGTYTITNKDGKQYLVNNGGFTWKQQPITAVTGPTFGTGEVAFQINDYQKQADGTYKEIKHPTFTNLALHTLNHYLVSVNDLVVANSDEGNFMPGILHGTQAAVTYNQDENGTVNHLDVYSNQTGHKLATYHLNQQGQFVSGNGQQLLAVNDQALKVNADDQAISPAQLQTIFNTPLLDSYGLNLAVLNTNLRVSDQTATGQAIVQLTDDLGNQLKLALPITASVHLTTDDQSDTSQPDHSTTDSTINDQPAHDKDDEPDSGTDRPKQSNQSMTTPTTSIDTMRSTTNVNTATKAIDQLATVSKGKLEPTAEQHSNKFTAQSRLAKSKQLPQTGNRQANVIGLLALVISLSATLITAGVVDRRKH